MGSSSPFVILTLLWLFRSFDSVLARLSNTTFDDTGSDITYSPASLWNDGTNCNGCTAHPDTTKMNGGTWHDSTHQPGGGQDALAFASLEFTGSAIYVFCAIAHSSVSPDGNSDMSFFLDGKQVGSFVLPPTGEAVYDYNVPVFVDETIPSGSHTLSIQNGSPGGAKSLILLDYIVVTSGEADPPSPPPPPPSSSSLPQPQAPTPPATQAFPTTPAPTSSATPVPQSATPIIPPSSVLIPSRTSSSSASSIVVTTIGTVATTVTSLAPTSPEAPEDAASPTQSSPNTSPSTSGSVAAANALTTSHKTRTTIIAAVVPSVIVLLLAIAGLVFCCMRRRRHEYHLPPDPEISKDPEASGWAPDAWSSRGAAASSSEFISSPSPSNFTPSNFTPVSTALLTDTGGTSSASPSGGASAISSPSEARRPAVRMTMGSISSVSAYSASDENHAAGPSTSALSSVSEESRSGVSSQPHPYAVRTPIATTPEPDFTPQSTSSVPIVVAPPPPLTKAEEAGFTLAYDDPAPPPMPPSGARPLPAQPTTSVQARATQVRRTFASTSSDGPPSYEDISRDGPVRL